MDQTLHISLEGLEAIHIDWKQGGSFTSRNKSTNIESMNLEPKSITAFLLGLNSRIATFGVQRDINNFRNEPLSAILPGVALTELWQMMNILESTLRLVSLLVLLAALLGLSAMLLASIRERIHEVQLFRVIGASPFFLFMLIELEALIISVVSILLAGFLLYGGLILFRDLFSQTFSLQVDANFISEQSIYMIFFILIATLICAAIPSLSIYNKANK